MASASNRDICFVCNKQKHIFRCQGCSKDYCFEDLIKHQQNLIQQLQETENNHDELRQNLSELISDPVKHPLMKQIDQWEQSSIDTIKQIALQCRQKWRNYSNPFLVEMEKKLYDLAQQIQHINRENDIDETDLNGLKQKLEELREQINQPPTVSLQQQSTSFINKISLRLPFYKSKNRRLHLDRH